MYPLLFKIGSIPIHTYGFLIALGFVMAMQVFKRLSLKSNLPVEKMLDLAFWNLIVGFTGARVLFVITRFDYFISDPLSIFKVWEGGLVFFGGPLAAIPFTIYFTKKHKISIWRAMDVLLPSLVAAHIFGRFGCLGAGCCYGRPTDVLWGIHLHSELVESSLRGLSLHPTQLYEAFSLMVLFVFLLRVFKVKKFDGQVGLTYFICYPIIRSIIEVYRGDLIRGFVIEDVLSTSQFISILVFLSALFILIYRLKSLPQLDANKKSNEFKPSKK